MASFEFTATIPAHSSQRWWTGGGGYYNNGHFPQFDVRVIAAPGVFPGPGPGPSPALIYKDFACAVNDRFPYDATYYLTVQNDSDVDLPYRMRIWLP